MNKMISTLSFAEYYNRLTRASNAINAVQGAGVDHHTITGFMNDSQKIEHLTRLEEEVNTLEE